MSWNNDIFSDFLTLIFLAWFFSEMLAVPQKTVKKRRVAKIIVQKRTLVSLLKFSFLKICIISYLTSTVYRQFTTKSLVLLC
ncbi:hypothetical protein BHL12_07565 [Bacillus cereus]|nr:hypothetical protein BHL12_07565 [Bacillus cereus]OTZ38580.1 hypothetical protein BK760_16375 [Bacillus thuringiensis serovar tolworthi]